MDETSGSNDELNLVGLESLVSHLAAQGLTPKIVEGSVLVEGIFGTDLLCHCEILPTPPNTHATITPISMEVSFLGNDNYGHNSDASPILLPPQSVRDIVVGLSFDRREAVVQATHIWCAGVFPPIYRACDPAPASEDDASVYPFQMATQDTATSAVQDWDVFLGPPQLGGPNTNAFATFLDEGKLMHLMMNALTAAARDVRMHWVKVYVAFQPDGTSIFECKLDNEDWPEGVAELQSVRWPRVRGFVQYRQFLVMRPSSAPDPTVHKQLENFAHELKQEPQNEASPKRRSWWPFGNRSSQK